MHIAGGWTHPSHMLRFHQDLGVWFCATCGMYGDRQLLGLGRLCPKVVSDTRAEYLSRIERGLFPKAYSKAELVRKTGAHKGP